MDIRDFAITADAPTGKTLEEVFLLQQELLNKYVAIEKLTKWPYNLNLPDSQVIIKDFIARVVEELGEAFESYDKLVIGWTRNHLDRPSVINNLYNFNEELADSLHFLIEVMIVSGITPQYLKEWSIATRFPADNLTVGVMDNLYELFRTPGRFCPDYSPEVRHLMDGLNDPFIMGGRWVSDETQAVLALASWEVTYHLMLARNSLKNKPWKQTHMNSDYKVYKSELARALVAFISLTEAMGITEQALFSIYYRKNQVNHFRIRTKY